MMRGVEIGEGGAGESLLVVVEGQKKAPALPHIFIIVNA
jgi:hypothetical protein